MLLLNTMNVYKLLLIEFNDNFTILYKNSCAFFNRFHNE